MSGTENLRKTKRNVTLVSSYDENYLANQQLLKQNKQRSKQVLKHLNKNQNKQETVPVGKGVSKDDFAITYKSIPDNATAKPKAVTSASTITSSFADTVSDAIASPITDAVSPTSDSKTHKAIYKIFPSSYPNNKGSYVGKEYIQLLKDPSFMDHFDDVDFYMNSLFKNMVNDLTDEKSIDKDGIPKKKTPRSILPYFEKVIQFDPTIYTKGGGKKSRKHRKTSNRRNTSNHRRKTYKKNKNQKRRTYKKKN